MAVAVFLVGVVARLHVLLLLLSVEFTVASQDWTDCPTDCRCKWMSGKKTAMCRDASLTTLPTNLNSDIQVLDLSENSIFYLPKNSFQSASLINLQRIFMRKARVRSIHKDAFKDLKILVEVDLSENELTTIQLGTFAGNERLRVLYLNRNPISVLLDGQFPHLPHFRTLEMEGCQLTQIHKNAFVNVGGLETLNLKGNRLRQMSESVFMSTSRIKTLALDENPWRCDCQLRGFRNWFLSSNLHSVSLTCSEPPIMYGFRWEDVTSEDFACTPSVTLTDNLIRAQIGGNVTFGCHVRGDPEPEVTWLYNERVIGSPNTTRPDQILVIAVEEGLLEKWTNISVFNLTQADVGEYSCVARNSRGAVAKNLTLALPELVTATTISKKDSWLLWAAVVCGSVATLISALVALICTCCVCSGDKQKRRRRHRRKAKMKNSVSFTDQEKKLLDVSITTSERPGSFEVLGGPQADVELRDQSPSIELCDPPVHITIESRTVGEEAATDATTSTLSVGGSGFPAQLGLFPPPPEFSTSILPAGAFGNIFISVSVSQDPVALDVHRYPDLLDIPHRAKPMTSTMAATIQGPLIYRGVSTLPRSNPQQQTHHVIMPELRMIGPQYDNMGPRITAGGSSSLSLPDASAEEDNDRIPSPPPPPPICTSHVAEYVSL